MMLGILGMTALLHYWHGQATTDAPTAAPSSSRRQRFEPTKGMADKTSWSVLDKPSEFNPNGWTIMAHISLGGVVPARLPGESQDFCRIKLLDGDDDRITLQIDEFKDKNVLILNLNRGQDTEITVNGRQYRVAYPPCFVAPNDPDTAPFAFVIVTGVDRPTFGRVIERVVPEAIDLDTGELASIPESVGNANNLLIDTLDRLDWLKQAGMDAACDRNGGDTLAGFGMKVEAMPDGAWDTATPAQLARTLAATKPKTYQPMPPGKDSPGTYAFQTREGGMGIIQVINLTGEGAQIRYKLVQQPAIPLAKQPAATHPTQETHASPDQVAVEDLAMEMLVAIRDKDDAKLVAAAVDLKGWREALPHFALEMRERFAQMTGKPFTMYPGESLVQGSRAVVKCTGPKELGGIYLVLFFVKTDAGWRNWTLRNSPPNKPLSDFLKMYPDAAPASEPAATQPPTTNPATTQPAQSNAASPTTLATLKTNAESQLQTIRRQLELYRIQHNDKPPTLGALCNNWSTLTTKTDADGHLKPDGPLGPYFLAPVVNPITRHSDIVPRGEAWSGAGWTYDEKTGLFRFIVPPNFDTTGLSPDQPPLRLGIQHP